MTDTYACSPRLLVAVMIVHAGYDVRPRTTVIPRDLGRVVPVQIVDVGHEGSDDALYLNRLRANDYHA